MLTIFRYVTVRMNIINSHYDKVALYDQTVKNLHKCQYETVTLTHQAPVTGSASFPLIMNNGNRMENTHPL